MSFSSAVLADFYRFALLLTGRGKSAELVVAETLAEARTPLADLRNETGRNAWMIARLRERCLRENEKMPGAAPRLLREHSATEKPQLLKIEAFLLAQRFHSLPEPERSALALFYLQLFSPDEIARLLKMNGEVLGETLAAGRQLLRQALWGAENSGIESPEKNAADFSNPDLASDEVPAP